MVLAETIGKGAIAVVLMEDFALEGTFLSWLLAVLTTFVLLLVFLMSYTRKHY